MVFSMTTMEYDRQVAHQYSRVFDKVVDSIGIPLLFVGLLTGRRDGWLRSWIFWVIYSFVMILAVENR